LRWRSESSPLSAQEYLNLSDIEKHVYLIYQDFYNPFNLNKYESHGVHYPEVGNDYYASLLNLIIQNRISYSVDGGLNLIEMENFRPGVSLPPAQNYYFTDYYVDEWNAFLDKNHSDLNSRIDFIHKKFKIDRMRSLTWLYITQPEVFSIYFNENMDSAKVNFGIRFEGGESEYVRTGETWSMISSTLTWIE
jgi:hypothetical protein